MNEDMIISKVQKLEQFLKGGVFKIPLYQREYSWDIEQIDNFWIDLITTTEDKPWFLGSIILLKEKNGKIFEIIDGQQRIATASLLIIALRNEFKNLENSLSSEKKRKCIQITENLNSLILTENNKKRLTLSQHDNDVFKQIVEAGKCANSGRSRSHKRIRKAFNFFQDRLNEEKKDTESYFNYLDLLQKKLLEYTILIQNNLLNDELAYDYFERLNDRGIALSSTDLIKNKLFSSAKEKLDDVIRNWDEIIQSVDETKLSAFIRYYLISTDKYFSHKEVYREVKSRIENMSAENFIEELKKYSKYYGSFEPNINRSRHEEVIENLAILPFEQWKIVGLSIEKLYDEKSINEVQREELYKLIENICVRSAICGINPNKLELLFSKVAPAIIKKKTEELKGSKENIECIKSEFVEFIMQNLNDKEFKKSFLNKEFSSGLAKAILISIEKRKNNSYRELNFMQFTIEHVMPKALNDEWEKDLKKWNSDPKKHKSYLNKLGNLTLLTPKDNSEIVKNKKFDEKRKIYKGSNIKITKELSKLEEFNFSIIDKRTEEFADLAVNEIWKLPNK